MNPEDSQSPVSPPGMAAPVNAPRISEALPPPPQPNFPHMLDHYDVYRLQSELFYANEKACLAEAQLRQAYDTPHG